MGWKPIEVKVRVVGDVISKPCEVFKFDFEKNLMPDVGSLVVYSCFPAERAALSIVFQAHSITFTPISAGHCIGFIVIRRSFSRAEERSRLLCSGTRCTWTWKVAEGLLG